MQQNTIKVVDFSKNPFGRKLKDGDFTAERFRDDFLIPALRKGATTVLLDGTNGELAPSFLEEAFGGLVRFRNFQANDLRELLIIVSDREDYIEEIWGYIEDAQTSMAFKPQPPP